jgi:predicted SAM-dependent methyltransferase
LRECYRVLENHGSIRIVVPDLGQAIVAYCNQTATWFGEWPRRFVSLGGRFTNYIFCESQHKCAFDHDFLAELLSSAGFVNTKPATLHQSSSPDHYWPALAELETESLDSHSLFVEAQKNGGN